MANQFDIFSMLGIETPKFEEEKKERKKDTKKASKRTSKSKETTYKLPLSVYTGYYEPFTIDEQDIEGKKALTEEDIKEILSKRYPEFALKYSKFEHENGKAYITLSRDGALAKGAITLNQESRLILAGTDYDVQSIMTDSECELDATAIIEHVKKAGPIFGEKVSLLSDGSGKVLVPFIELPELTKSLVFPVRILILGREKISITKEEHQSFINATKGKNKDNQGDKSKESKKEDDNEKMSPKAIQDFIVSKYPEFKERIKLQYNKELHMVLCTMKAKSNGNEVKKVTYPVEGTIISLLFNRITLTPDMFDGQEEIDDDDVIAFLGKDYPEFSKDRTQILYDEKKKLIIPNLIGSRKGAVAINNLKDASRELRKYYSLFEIKHDGAHYRCEKTPVGIFCADMDRKGFGNFEYHLPKIPYSMLGEGYRFLCDVFNELGTEGMLQLFYDPKKQSYFWYCPKQLVTPISIDLTRNYKLEQDCWLILDLHSHGKLPAFFSQVDNADEKGTRLYGVLGGFSANPGFQLRAGTGGYFINIEPDEIFECKDTFTDGLSIGRLEWFSRITSLKESRLYAN